ncbi:substrate-binding domain-containing protein [Streptomyces shaanxiensis]
MGQPVALRAQLGGLAGAVGLVADRGDQPYPTGEAAQLRTQGYRLAHERAGIPVREELIISTPRFNRSDGASAMAHLLDLEEPPDAVFCYSDLVALGALHTLAARGLRVPEDVAVVGYDDIEDGRYSNPPVTTISPDKKMIAETAVERLLKRIGKLNPCPRHGNPGPAPTHPEGQHHGQPARGRRVTRPRRHVPRRRLPRRRGGTVTSTGGRRRVRPARSPQGRRPARRPYAGPSPQRLVAGGETRPSVTWPTAPMIPGSAVGGRLYGRRGRHHV